MPGLKAALAAANTSQSKLAKRLGVLPSAVNLYARGVSDPSIDRLRTIAAIVGCTLESLVYPPTADAAPAVVVAATA